MYGGGLQVHSDDNNRATNNNNTRARQRALQRLRGEVQDLHRLRCRYGVLLQTVRRRAQAQIGSQYKAAVVEKETLQFTLH